MKRIAVLGGGGTGCTLAADLTVKGCEVALYESADDWENLKEVQKAEAIHVTGQIKNADAQIKLLTDDMREAVNGAELIFIAVVAYRHEAICKELAPLLQDGQIVCFSAGYCGSILLRRYLHKDRDVVIGETQGNLYSCRLVDHATVFCATPYTPKKAAAFPGKDTGKLIDALKDLYPCSPCKNILEATLNSPNISGHLAGSLLNTCAIERNPGFRLYMDGLSDGVINCMQEVENEKCAVMEAAGLSGDRQTDMAKRLMQYGRFPELDDFRSLSGPNSMKHRYISEDASTGQTILISLGKATGVATPCSEALVVLASVINRTDYLKNGRSLESLGLGGMTIDQIYTYLETMEAQL